MSSSKILFPLTFFLLFITGLQSCRTLSIQKPEEKETVLFCGESSIVCVSHIGDQTPKLTFLNVHEDEQTSIEALKSFALENPINYCYFRHTGERRIAFTLNDSIYSIDPNRMFTDEGRRKTLEDGENWSPAAEQALQNFAENFLRTLPKADLIVALHNNTPDNYSIQSYLPDSSEAQNTGQLYINPKMDPDDFIYTTDSLLFAKFREHKVNTILQDPNNFVDDGSLSVYCGLKKLRYVNIETEHGHLKEQETLLELLCGFLEKN